MTPILRDGQILLRPFTQSDAGAIYDAVRESLPELQPWMPWYRETYSPGDATEFITHCLECWERDTQYNFAIVEEVSGQFIGGCGLNAIDHDHWRANLGYWIRSSRTGHGFASTAATLVARYGFEELGLRRLEIVVAVGNERSRRVAEKSGALFEGILRQRIRIREMQHDAYGYSLIRDAP